MTHARERLGRLARWALLAGCAVVVAAGALAVMLALGGTVNAATGWMVHSDGVGRVQGDWFCLPVRMPPGQRNVDASNFYWQDGAGRILLPGWPYRSSHLLKMPSSQALGMAVFRPLPSPYSGFFPTTPAVRFAVEPKRHLVVLLDVRTLLATDPAGSMAQGATDDAPTGVNGDAPLDQLARLSGLAYFTTAPLNQYLHIREQLGHAPPGAVIAVGDSLDRPCSDAHAADICKDTRDWTHGVLLVTSSRPFAQEAAKRGLLVALLGDSADVPAGVIGLPTWGALMNYIRSADLRAAWKPFEY